jgi:hypothetical protein
VIYFENLFFSVEMLPQRGERLCQNFDIGASCRGPA